MNPAEFALLLAMIQAVPAIAQSIQLAQSAQLTPEQMAQFQAERDASIDRYLKATGQA